MLKKNSDRFSQLNSQQRTTLFHSLVQFCGSNHASVRDLAALPLFHNIFGKWIALGDKVQFAELDPRDLPPGLITLVSQFEFAREILPMQPRAIHEYLGQRTRNWNRDDFLEYIFTTKACEKNTKSIFDCLLPQERQSLLAMTHRPTVRLPPRFLDNVAFIPFGNELLPQSKVFADHDPDVRVIVELLGLPCVTSFFAAQLAILKATYMRITLDEVRSREQAATN